MTDQSMILAETIPRALPPNHRCRSTNDTSACSSTRFWISTSLCGMSLVLAAIVARLALEQRHRETRQQLGDARVAAGAVAGQHVGPFAGRQRDCRVAPVITNGQNQSR